MTPKSSFHSQTPLQPQLLLTTAPYSPSPNQQPQLWTAERIRALRAHEVRAASSTYSPPPNKPSPATPFPQSPFPLSHFSLHTSNFSLPNPPPAPTARPTVALGNAQGPTPPPPRALKGRPIFSGCIAPGSASPNKPDLPTSPSQISNFKSQIPTRTSHFNTPLTENQQTSKLPS